MSETTDENEGARDARTGWVWRGALLVYVITLVGLIVAYLMVASMQVRTSVYMLGKTSWVAGHPSAFRGTIMDPLTGRRWHDARGIEVRLLTSAQASRTPLRSETPSGVVLARPEVGAAGVVQFEVTPEVEPGEYVVSLRALAGPSHDLFEARAAVTVRAPEPERASAPWPPRTTRREQAHREDRLGVLSSEGPVRIDVLRAEPELARGLPTVVHLLVTDRATGEPLACEVTFDAIKGMVQDGRIPTRVRTNAFGLARLNFAPTLAHTWELSTSCLPPSMPPVQGAPVDQAAPEPVVSSSMIHLSTVASQASASAAEPIAWGERVEGGITSLRAQEGFFVDVYYEDRWEGAQIFGLGSGDAGWSMRTGRPEEGARIARLQLSQDLFLVGNAWDVVHVVQVSPELARDRGRAREQAWRLLHTRFASSEVAGSERARHWAWWSSEDGRARWESAKASAQSQALFAWLTAIPAHYAGAEVLVNSQHDDEVAMARWREAARAELIMVIGLAMLVGVIALGVLVVQGLGAARARQAMLEQIDLEFDDDGASAQDLGRRAGLVSAVQIVVVFGTIVVFGLSLIMLLRFM